MNTCQSEKCDSSDIVVVTVCCHKGYCDNHHEKKTVHGCAVNDCPDNKKVYCLKCADKFAVRCEKCSLITCRKHDFGECFCKHKLIENKDKHNCSYEGCNRKAERHTSCCDEQLCSQHFIRSRSRQCAVASCDFYKQSTCYICLGDDKDLCKNCLVVMCSRCRENEKCSCYKLQCIGSLQFAYGNEASLIENKYSYWKCELDGSVWRIIPRYSDEGLSAYAEQLVELIKEALNLGFHSTGVMYLKFGKESCIITAKKNKCKAIVYVNGNRKARYSVSKYAE